MLRYARSRYAARKREGARGERLLSFITEAKSTTPRTTLPRARRDSRLHSADHHTTVLDPPRGRASYALLAAVLLGGATGLAVGLARSDDVTDLMFERELETPRAALELMPSLDAIEAPPQLPVEVALAPTSIPSSSPERVTSAPVAAAAVIEDAASVQHHDRVVVTDRLRDRESLSVALARHGLAGEQVGGLIAALRGNVDLRGLRPGDVFRVESQGDLLESGALVSFEYRPLRTSGAPVRWRASLAEDRWQGEKVTTPVTTEVVPLAGEVQSSLYVAMRALGEGSTLVSRFVDVFAWDIDFYRQPQRGDTFKVLVEKQFAEGRFVGYGRVLAAEYVNAGEVHRGFAFQSGDGKLAGFFDENGRARQKTFLRNPLESVHVTSRYGQRFHPVLRQKKAHHGVDYGAGTGTPFWAIADGVVEEARYSPTAGNMIVVRHMGGYATEYFHASRFAEGIRPGARVRQRQVIGYVGSTGRSTGPHLHFGMKKRGGYVDPAKQVFPPAEPVPKKYQKEFNDIVGPLLVELEAIENA
ncbi:MAG: peptidoglycan DD-metalloendopeptidase family protein [Myxococcota bacterium]